MTPSTSSDSPTQSVASSANSSDLVEIGLILGSRRGQEIRIVASLTSESDTLHCGGLAVGDYIRTIEGESVLGLSQATIVKMMLGNCDEESSILVGVERETHLQEKKNIIEPHFVRIAERASWIQWLDSMDTKASSQLPLSRFLWVFHDCELHLEAMSIEQPNLEQLERMPIKQCMPEDLRKAVLLRNAERTLMTINPTAVPPPNIQQHHKQEHQILHPTDRPPIQQSKKPEIRVKLQDIPSDAMSEEELQESTNQQENSYVSNLQQQINTLKQEVQLKDTALKQAMEIQQLTSKELQVANERIKTAEEFAAIAQKRLQEQMDISQALQASLTAANNAHTDDEQRINISRAITMLQQHVRQSPDESQLIQHNRQLAAQLQRAISEQEKAEHQLQNLERNKKHMEEQQKLIGAEREALRKDFLEVGALQEAVEKKLEEVRKQQKFVEELIHDKEVLSKEKAVLGDKLVQTQALLLKQREQSIEDAKIISELKITNNQLLESIQMTQVELEKATPLITAWNETAVFLGINNASPKQMVSALRTLHERISQLEMQNSSASSPSIHEKRALKAEKVARDIAIENSALRQQVRGLVEEVSQIQEEMARLRKQIH